MRNKDNTAYACWLAMKDRCARPANPSYRWYGGRGVTVCERWRNSFEAFLADMGPRPSLKHTLDRKDTNGNYEPGNCRWATPIEQGRNKRSVVLLTAFGETHCLLEWSRKLGVRIGTIARRLALGWSAEQSLSATPLCPGYAQPHEIDVRLIAAADAFRARHGDTRLLRRKRCRFPRGEALSRSKLSDESVLWMRFARQYAGATNQRLADAFGVTVSGAQRITQGEARARVDWSSLPRRERRYLA